MNIEETRRNQLSKLIQEKYKNQAGFIRETGINQGELSAILRGKKSFGEKKARKLEEDAGLPSGWLDQDHNESSALLPVNRDSTQVPEGYTRISVPDVEAHAGAGGIVNPGILMNVDISESWIRDVLNINPKNAAPIPVHGDSMHPTLQHGELAIYDKSITFYNGDGIYVISQEDLVRVKRLQMMPGKLRIISDNKFYDTEIVTGEDMNLVRIIGRVAGVAGVRKI